MQSKDALDKIIRKSRVHFYKPIQIAEILFNHRMDKAKKLDCNNLESYRNVSKRWRDEVTKRLVGRISTSSQKYQDNVFETNAMPPIFLAELATYNAAHKGVVEAYIYHQLKKRLEKVAGAQQYLESKNTETFELSGFLEKFVKEPGLKRSIDKVYEIVVYALFYTLVDALKVQVTLQISNFDNSIMRDFKKFIKSVLGLSEDRPSMTIPATIHRLGVTNAADRGLDMWTNYGPAIQVKHLSLSEDLASDVVETIAAEKIIIVCLDGEEKLIARLLTQLSFSPRIQSIITISDLTEWYKLCLSGKYKAVLGQKLILNLRKEFRFEFPTTTELEPFLKERKYDAALLKGIWVLDKDLI